MGELGGHGADHCQPFGLQLRLFQPLALGNVAQNRRTTDDAALQSAQFGDGHLHQHMATVFRHAFRLHVIMPFGADMLFDTGQLTRLHQFRRHDQAEGLADDFFGAPTEDDFRGAVPGAEAILGVQREDYVGRVVDDAFQLLQMAEPVAGDVGVHRQ